MKTKNEIRDWLLKNAVNGYGTLDLSELDLSGFEGNVKLSSMKVKGNLFQGNQEVKGNLIQSFQEVKGDLIQGNQKVKGELWQDKIMNNKKYKGVKMTKQLKDIKEIDNGKI